MRKIGSEIFHTIGLQSALSILIKSADNLIKILYLAHLVYHLYKNMILSILPDLVSIVNISRAFLSTFLQSFICSLIIVYFSIIVLVWSAKLYIYVFLPSLSTNLIVQIAIFFTIIIFSKYLRYLLVFK